VIVDNAGTVLGRNDYYPFGKLWEGGTVQAPTTRYTFSGKEKQTVRNLGWLDFSARMLSNDTDPPRWTTQDPLAEKYYSVSQYAYCGNNPVNRIDPNGMEWLNKRDEEIAKQLQQEITNRDKSLAKDEQKIKEQIENIKNKSKWTDEKKEKKIAKQQEKLDDVQEQRTHLSDLNEGITQLGSSKTTYTFNTVEEGSTAFLSSMSDGTIVINNYGTSGNRAHEATHAIQYNNGGITFKPLGSDNAIMKSPSVFEILSYRTEYSITGGIVPASDAKRPRYVFEVNLPWLYGVKDPNTGKYFYIPANYK
jgi:RHS repeat-associated protein